MVQLMTIVWLLSSSWCWSHLQLWTKQSFVLLIIMLCLCLVKHPVCAVLYSKWQYRPSDEAASAMKEVVTGRGQQTKLCVRLMCTPPARGHDGRGGGHARLQLPRTHVPCHVLYSTRVCVCVWTELQRAESHAVSPRSPSNRLWLSEAGAFLQFVLTSLLNHLHYLTVFPQRELQLSL